jgi:predicted transcriptional regulator
MTTETTEIEIHVEQGVEAMAARFVDAWHRAEGGAKVDERHLSLESWDGLSRVLTGRRLELLRYLRHHPVPSIAALARGLQRDYKRVHEDVEALGVAGLLTRDAAGLRIGYDEIRTSIAV